MDLSLLAQLPATERLAQFAKAADVLGSLTMTRRGPTDSPGSFNAWQGLTRMMHKVPVTGVAALAVGALMMSHGYKWAGAAAMAYGAHKVGNISLTHMAELTSGAMLMSSGHTIIGGALLAYGGSKVAQDLIKEFTQPTAEEKPDVATRLQIASQRTPVTDQLSGEAGREKLWQLITNDNPNEKTWAQDALTTSARQVQR